MLALLAVILTADGSPCDAAPPAPKVPMPSEFQCPVGATQQGNDCLSREGKPTGDSLTLDGKSGLMVHPLGMSVAWSDGVISWWQQRPTGHRVVYEGGKPMRIEHYVGGDLQCARHYDQGRLVKRFDDGKWAWLDKQGKPIDTKVPLEKSDLGAVMREHAAEVQLCYEGRLREVKGDFRGNVAFKVEIVLGVVKSVKVVEDTLRDQATTDCIAGRIRDWQFRVALDEVEVTFPFVFKERR
ncbi:MAG: AgmX/PglI C-terminal domain-containing protein [Myxococcaceae bacterium]|nr:AgmX/PglI C-terminal domain-containing protein [Myxococcaceae bacterium]